MNFLLFISYFIHIATLLLSARGLIIMTREKVFSLCHMILCFLVESEDEKAVESTVIRFIVYISADKSLSIASKMNLVRKEESVDRLELSLNCKERKSQSVANHSINDI